MDKMLLLSLNYNKTTCFVIYPNRIKNNTKDFCMTVGSHNITFPNYTKYLGIIIDTNLYCSNHCDYSSNKLSKAAEILCRIRHKVGKKTLINLYCLSIP